MCGETLGVRLLSQVLKAFHLKSLFPNRVKEIFLRNQESNVTMFFMRES